MPRVPVARHHLSKLALLAVLAGLAWAPAADAAQPKISVKDAAAQEPESLGDRGKMKFTVKASEPVKKATEVGWDTGSDTASPFDDYKPGDGTVTIKRGERTAIVKVTIFGDDEVEGDERFDLAIFGEGLRIDNELGSGTIRDSD